MNKKQMQILAQELPEIYPKFKYIIIPPNTDPHFDCDHPFEWLVGLKVTVLITLKNGRKRIIQVGDCWYFTPDELEKESFGSLRRRIIGCRDSIIFSFGRDYKNYQLLDPDDKEDNEIINKYLKKK